MDTIIHTPRLILIRLTNTTPGSQHVQWFHENWSDPEATAWSLHGPCHSLAESRDWMIEHLTKYDNMFYAVFAKPNANQGVEVEGVPGGVGEHLGSASLRRQVAGATLPPLKEEDGENEGNESGGKGKDVDLRVMGYALFEAARGKGYATEANIGLLQAYAASVAEEKAKGEKKFYVEAGVDKDNPGSQAVLHKLGLKKVGWKEEKEPVFLNGAWRDPGYWIYGLYV